MGSGHLCQHVIEESWPLAKGPYCEQLRGWIKKDSDFCDHQRDTTPENICRENKRGDHEWCINYNGIAMQV